MAKHQAAVVESGGPLGKTKRIGPQGISDMRNNLVGMECLPMPGQG